MVIVLIGYMGSGKSVVGKQIANIINYDFCDLDDYIETKEAKSISEIFSIKGEIYFRKQEHYYLNRLLQTSKNIVISLGGGTPCYGNNMDTILTTKDVISIYLKTSIPELAKRLFLEKQKRPLISHLKSKDLLAEFIGKHLFERSNYYTKSSVIVSTSGLKVSEIVERLILKLF